MKKYVTYAFLILLLLFPFAGCKNNSIVSFKGFYKISENAYQIDVSERQSVFNFYDYITVNSSYSWYISKDIEGNDIVNTKSIDLNKYSTHAQFFLFIYNNEGYQKLYTLNIYIKQVFTVSFESNMGDRLFSVKVDEGEILDKSIQPPQLKGYEFVDWNENIFIPITQNTTFICNYVPKIYKIRFYESETSGNYVEKLVSYKSDVVVDNNLLKKDGYQIKQWYFYYGYNTKVFVKDGFNYFLDKDLDFYAEWEPVLYNILYHLDGGENSQLNPLIYNIETETFLLHDAVKTGFIFDGWYTDPEYNNKITQIVKGSSGDIQIYAKFIKE